MMTLKEHRELRKKGKLTETHVLDLIDTLATAINNGDSTIGVDAALRREISNGLTELGISDKIASEYFYSKLKGA